MLNRQSNPTPATPTTLAPTRGREDSRNHASTDDDASTTTASSSTPSYVSEKPSNAQAALTVIQPGDRDRKPLHPFPHPVPRPHITFLHYS